MLRNTRDYVVGLLYLLYSRACTAGTCPKFALLSSTTIVPKLTDTVTASTTTRAVASPAFRILICLIRVQTVDAIAALSLFSTGFVKCASLRV